MHSASKQSKKGRDHRSTLPVGLTENLPGLASDEPDDTLLAEFDTRLRRKNVRLFRVFVPAGILLIVAFMPWDWFMSDERAPTTALVRVGIVVMLLLVYALSGTEIFFRFHDWFIAGAVAGAGVGICIVLSILPNGFVVGGGGLALVIMYAAGAVRMRPLHTGVSCSIVWVTMVAMMVVKGYDAFLIVSNAMMMFSFCVLSVLYNLSSRRDTFTVFLYGDRLLAEKSRAEALLADVTNMRAEREQWLENLARFLRHELKNQVTAAETSLTLAATAGSMPPPPRSQRYLDRAAQSLRRMRQLVESATEATSIEAALSLNDIAPVDLAMLVAERGQSFRVAHPDRRFELLLPSSLVVIGHDVRLEQLVDKLLGNAVEHTADGGRIRVMLERDSGVGSEGPSVVLRVENEGDALPGDRDAIFDPYVTSQATADNTGLGLYVVRVVAEAHGGGVTAYDVSWATGAGFEVRLPVGR